jgi:hypothetical protein
MISKARPEKVIPVLPSWLEILAFCTLGAQLLCCEKPTSQPSSALSHPGPSARHVNKETFRPRDIALW